jgi:hypothetical protein
VILITTRMVLNIGDVRIAQAKCARGAESDERDDEC